MSDNDYLTANKLAAISTALMSDTPVSMAASLLPVGHALDTAAYRDAIRAVEKIIYLRSRVEALARVLATHLPRVGIIGCRPCEGTGEDEEGVQCKVCNGAGNLNWLLATPANEGTNSKET